MPEDVPLGTLLRRYRRAAGMTLEELAEASGVSARAISDMERGRTHTPQRRCRNRTHQDGGRSRRGLTRRPAWPRSVGPALEPPCCF